MTKHKWLFLGFGIGNTIAMAGLVITKCESLYVWITVISLYLISVLSFALCVFRERHRNNKKQGGKEE